MGKKFRKALLAFIDGIPDHKLEGGLPSIQKTLYEDDNYRLDMQNVNRHALFTSARKAGQKGATVGKVLVPVEEPWTAWMIKETLKQSCIDFGDQSNQF
ncbi:uncharacterized protein J4E92_007083 [Alternaria infectoria]|uniref:uncharacterized protein n=1 Tax=Alternaria arbusti TaxID=232088 RepID=UPI00222043E4|nr:uncharacterized protein J4E86_009062 [Alternaria arbusti]XP_051351380.1 uncharacterized protein J4E92_007083 [Alternaria infectoria]KAI4925045.1 hypothetical protein J4E92_007083 [Alternaria infectoria]KAI4946357.1 hypothetical protein J4E86_009062 [Alternaria arbusti]